MGWKRRFVTTLYYRVQVPDLTQQRDLAGAPAGRSARSFSRWTSTRAVLLAAAGQNRWPPAGSYMAATGQDLMAADNTKRRDEAEHTSFDFLGYTFCGRRARGRRGFFVSFSPAVSPNAKKAIGKQISHWHLNRRSATDLASLAGAINARIRGWFNYYGAFYRSELYAIAARIDEHLLRWAMQKFKRLRGQPTKAQRWLDAALWVPETRPWSLTCRDAGRC